MQLERGKIYVGNINREPSYYLGYWSYDGEGAPKLHQFEYVKYHEKVAGYGQTEEQAQKENYTEHGPLTTLYGRKDG